MYNKKIILFSIIFISINLVLISAQIPQVSINPNDPNIESNNIGVPLVNIDLPVITTSSVNYSTVNVNNSEYLDGYDSSYFYPYSNPHNFINSSANDSYYLNSNPYGYLNTTYNITYQNKADYQFANNTFNGSGNFMTYSTRGNEQLTNPNFDTDTTGWTLGTAWRYDATQQLVRKQVSGTTFLNQSVANMSKPIEVGQYYTLTFTISNITGSVTPTFAGYNFGSYFNNGTFIISFVAMNLSELRFTPSTTARFSLDNISVVQSGGLIKGGDFLFSRGSTSQTGVGCMWIESKSSMRCGNAGTGTDWTDQNVGTNTFIFGQGGIVKGTGSASFGSSNTINSLYSFSAGSGNSISSDAPYSTALGQSNQIKQTSSVLGFSNDLDGLYSVAIGSANNPDSLSAVTIGSSNSVDSATNYGITIGNSNTIDTAGESALAIGTQNTASGYLCMVFGTMSTCAETDAIVFGQSNYGGGYASFSSGYGVASTGQGSFAVGVNNNDDATSTQSVVASGDGSIAIGYANVGEVIRAIGTGSVAIGQNIESLNAFTYVFGKGYSSDTENSFNLGWDQLDYLFTSTNAYFNDSKVWFGSSAESSITYNTTDLVINPKEVGTGNTYNKGNLIVEENFNVTSNVHIDGNLSVKRPYGMFSDNTTQVIGAVSTAQVVNFSITEDSYLIYLTDKQNFTVAQSGDYLIEVSAIYTVDTPSQYVEFWVEKNGRNVPRSNTRMQIPNANTEIALAVPFILDLYPTDQVRFMTATSNAGSSLVYTTNTSYSPETPSIIVTFSKISEIPSV